MAKKADQMLLKVTDDYLRQAWQSEIEKISGVALQQQKTKKSRAPTRERFREKSRPSLTVTPLKHDRFMAALLQRPTRFLDLPEDAFHFFIDTDPSFQVYSRAFSLTGIEENTELDIAAQLMREFPDNQNIARWVNLSLVEDNEFQMLLIDMHITYLDGLRSRSDGLSVIIQLNQELEALRNQQTKLHNEYKNNL